MHEEQFPVFKDGQTLTHHELNDLRKYLDSQDHVLGRLIGFGITCGLEGEVVGDELVISPGLAIDQHGRPLMLHAEERIPLPPVIEGEFDFLDADGCVTPVLTATDEPEDAPDCEEDGCIGHAGLVVRKATIVLANGSVAQSSFSVAATPLGAISPISVGKNSRASNTGAAMIAALKRALGRHLTGALARKLDDAIINNAEDLPGVQAWKAAFLNRVFFATLDLLRCEVLTSASCIRTSETPGVALGCLRNEGEFSWSCSPRHGFEPPVGLAVALLGSDCDDPCALLAERVRAMISSFFIPAMPKPADPPKPGGGGIKYCRRYAKSGSKLALDRMLWDHRCVHWEIPWKRRPEWERLWDIDYELKNPLDVIDIRDLYLFDPDQLDAGTISTGLTLGLEPAEAVIGVETAIRDAMGDDFPVDVTVVTPRERQAMDAYQPAVEASVTDRIVLVADNQGKVVEVGRIPVSETLNTVAPTVERVKADTGAAVSTASEARDLAAGAVADIADVRVRNDEISGVLFGLADQVGLIDRVGQIGDQVDVFAASGAASVDYVDRTMVAIERDVDRRIAEATAGVSERLKADTDAFRAEMSTWIGRADQRIDSVVYAAGTKPAGPGFDRGYLDAFGALGTAIRETAGDDVRPEVEAALRETERVIGRMEAASGLGSPVEPELVVTAMEGMVEALRAGGASGTQLRGVNGAIGRIRRGFG